jgi:hypothetical protein
MKAISRERKVVKGLDDENRPGQIQSMTINE